MLNQTMIWVFLGIAGMPMGAFLVWGIVRWLNWREDPRHANRPADDP